MGRHRFIIAFILFIVLLAIALFVTKEYGKDSSIPEELRDFSIRDTADIERIFIADQDESSVLLERTKKGWTVNDSMMAQQPQIDMVLGTLYEMKAEKPVTDGRMETVLKNMSALNKKLEVYMKGDGDEPSKTYFIGTNTPRHDGTYMLLETPDHGKADRPFVVGIPYQRGFLNPRFFTDVDEWRYTGVFDYKVPNIQRVEVEHVNRPESSFYIENGPDGVSLYRMMDDKRIERFDTVRIKDYLLNFKKAHVETFGHGLPDEKVDSIQKSGPRYRLRVIDKAGDTNELAAYMKAPPEDPRPGVEDLEYDVDRMYAKTDNGEFAVIQRYVFGRFFQSLPEMRRNYKGRQRGYRNLGPEPPDGYTPVPRSEQSSKEKQAPPAQGDTARPR